MAPPSIRNDTTVVSPQSGGRTVTGRTDLFQTPGSLPGAGRFPADRTVADSPAALTTGSDGERTVSLSSAGGQRRSLQQIAESQGMTVTELLAAPSNSSLRNLYENQIQMMLDKYRTYEHQLRRATNQPLVESQVANDVSWIPTDIATIHVPSRRAPDSPERLLEDSAIDRSEIDTLVAQVPDERYRGVVRRALESTQQASVDGDEGPDLRELYSQGQDHLPLDTRLVGFLYGQSGMRLNASNLWSVASLRASMTQETNLRDLDPSQVTPDMVRQGMVVTSRDRSRAEVVVSGLETNEDGVLGVGVVCPDRSQGSEQRGMVYEFRPLSELDSAGYPGLASA